MKKYLVLLVFLLPAIMVKAQKNTHTKVSGQDGFFDKGVEEQSAFFPGGVEKFYAYLKQNSKYPLFTENGQSIKPVFVGFIVQKDGTLTDVHVLRSASPEFDAEAIRLIKASPPWIPGEQNGVKIKQQYIVPVRFAEKNQQL